MKIKFSIILITLSVGLTSCQMDRQDFDTGLAQKVARESIEESDISDVVDTVATEEEERLRRQRREVMASLTDDYSNIPSSNDVTDFIDHQLSPSVPTCFVDENGIVHTREVLGKGALGARQVLATMYQSCNAIDVVVDGNTPPLRGVSTQLSRFTDGTRYKQRRINNKAAMVRSHEVLSQLNRDENFPGPSCIDTTKHPPVYGYGSRKGLRSNEINLFTRGQGVANNGVAASGIDCSEFISTAFAAEGLKFNTGDRDFKSFTTRSLHDISDDKNSCVKPAQFRLPQSINSGDIINVAGSHVIMVDTVGEDPLGIRKNASAGTCSSITASDFDFTYIHSGALNNYGPARVDAKIHAQKRSTMFRSLTMQARKACRDFVKGKQSSQKQRLYNFSIMRHESANPKCYYDKPAKLKGRECVAQCLEERKSNVH